MKIKIMVFVSGCLLAAVPAGMLNALSVDKIKESGEAFTEAMSGALPLYSELGLNWPDAYIGQLISVPPHLGAGVSLGTVFLKENIFRDFMGTLGGNPKLDNILGAGILPPLLIAELRLGGIFAPFDIGVKAGIPAFKSMGYDSRLAGADIRFALISIKVIKFSLGFGYNYLSGSYSEDLNDLETSTGNGETLTVKSPDVRIDWQINSINMKLQCSLDIPVLTPYLGLGGQFCWHSKADYTVSGDFSEDREAIAAFNKAGISLDGNSFSSGSGAKTYLEPYLFGGLSLKLNVVRLDFNLLAGIKDFNIGASTALRVRL